MRTAAAQRGDAYHTHEALPDAARAIILLIETVRIEAAAVTGTAGGPERRCPAW